MGFIHYQDESANLVFNITRAFPLTGGRLYGNFDDSKKERIVMKVGKLDDATRSLLTKKYLRD